MSGDNRPEQPAASVLLGVELDDEGLADRHVDVFALGERAHGDLLATFTSFKPANEIAIERVTVVLHDDHLLGLGRQRNDLAALDAEAGDVDSLAVDENQTVVDELTCLRAG